MLWRHAHNAMKNYQPVVPYLKRLVIFLVLILTAGLVTKPAYASCIGAITGNSTLANTTCTISSFEGVDAGEGTSNTGELRLGNAVSNPAEPLSITINDGGTLVAGFITILNDVTINIFATGAEIRAGSTAPIYAQDADSDGYADLTAVMQTTSGDGFVRLSALSSAVISDCNDGASTVWLSHAQCYKDNDMDTYTAGLAPNSTCLNNASCNAATSASDSVNGAAATAYTATQIKNAANLNSLGADDCDDTDAAKWVIGAYGCGQ